MPLGISLISGPGWLRSLAVQSRPASQGLIGSAESPWPAAILTTVVGVAVAVLVGFAALVLLPIRITYGAGSVRCGVLVQAYGQADCRPAAGKRVRETLAVTAVLLVLAVTPIIAARFVRRRWARRLVGVLLALGWVVVLPLALLVLTGAHAA